MVLAVCDTAPMSTLPDVTATINVAFANPYGFLPGQMYG